eukprot:7900000-Alexandrium_andersonii.AAC.1
MRVFVPERLWSEVAGYFARPTRGRKPGPTAVAAELARRLRGDPGQLHLWQTKVRVAAILESAPKSKKELRAALRCWQLFAT